MKIIILLWGIIALASNSVECCSTSSGRTSHRGGTSGSRGTSGSGGTSGSAGVGGGLLDDDFASPTPTAQELACRIEYLSGEDGIIYLVENNGYYDERRRDDGADAASNIRTTCRGGMAKRSSGPCPNGFVTLGGYVSLKESVLSYILEVASEGDYNPANKLQINVLAGECHLRYESWHMAGRSVDIQIRDYEPTYYYESWMRICRERGGTQNLGPPRTDHTRHTHCGFPP